MPPVANQINKNDFVDYLKSVGHDNSLFSSPEFLEKHSIDHSKKENTTVIESPEPDFHKMKVAVLNDDSQKVLVETKSVSNSETTEGFAKSEPTFKRSSRIAIARKPLQINKISSVRMR